MSIKIEAAGNFYIVTSRKPLTTKEQIFSKLSFVSCRASISPQSFNPEIVIDSASPKGDAYCWILNDIEQAQHVGSLFRYPTLFNHKEEFTAKQKRTQQRLIQVNQNNIQEIVKKLS